MSYIIQAIALAVFPSLKVWDVCDVQGCSIHGARSARTKQGL